MIKFKTLTDKHPNVYRLLGDKVSQPAHLRAMTPAIIDLLEGLAEYGYCHPITPKGRGKWTHTDDRASTIRTILDGCGVPYVSCNTAPRGARTGYCIVLAGEDSIGSCWSKTREGDDVYYHYTDGTILTRATKVQHMPSALVATIVDLTKEA